MKRFLFKTLFIFLLALQCRAALKDLSAGSDLIYAARFEEAEKRFQKAKDSAPLDIAPRFFLAANKLGEIAFKGEDDASLNELDQRIEEC